LLIHVRILSNSYDPSNPSVERSFAKSRSARSLQALALTMLSTLKHWLNRRKPLPLSEWFFVTYDESTVFVKAAPRGKEPWEQSFSWSSIVRVCFKDVL
jgi:hypothetical protein